MRLDSSADAWPAMGPVRLLVGPTPFPPRCPEEGGRGRQAGVEAQEPELLHSREVGPRPGGPLPRPGMDAATSLELSGTTRHVTQGGRAWLALTARVHAVGMEEAFRALTACALGIRGAFGSERAMGFSPCCRWFCPPCARRRQRNLTRAWIASLQEAMNGTGGCAFLTLTLPGGSPASRRLASIRQSLDKLRRRVAWKSRPHGWGEKVGILCALEVSAGRDGDGHPHAHLLVFGPDAHVVQGCQDWLLATWLSLHPAASRAGQRPTQVIPHSGCWRAKVSYLFKGTRLDPSWSPATLRLVLGLFPSGSRAFVTWGRLTRVFKPGRNACRKRLPWGRGGLGLPACA